MKNLKKFILHSFLFLVTISILYSCKKDNSSTAPIDNSVVRPTGSLVFHLHTFLDNNEVDAYHITYSTLDGRKISLSLAQLYITDIQLLRLDGSVYAIPGSKILKMLDIDTYLAGKVPVGNYKAIRFKVGLDAATNALSPNADSSLLNHSEMWFGANAQPDGYVFMHVMGQIDTTSNHSGVMLPFEYKIGGAANYKQVQMPDKNLTILKDQLTYAHIIIDYNNLFQGVSLVHPENLSVVKLSDNTSAAGIQIANNIPAMFVYEP